MRYIKCVDCDHKYCEFCNAGDKYYKKAKSNAVTNFDRIKAMSVEEMAEFLKRVCIGKEVEWTMGGILRYLESEGQEDE